MFGLPTQNFIYMGHKNTYKKVRKTDGYIQSDPGLKINEPKIFSHSHLVLLTALFQVFCFLFSFVLSPYMKTSLINFPGYDSTVTKTKRETMSGFADRKLA